MRRTLSVVAFVGLAAVAPTLSAARETPGVAVGTRVRFSPAQTPREKVIGTVAGQRGDMLLLRTERQDTVEVAPADLDHLEVSEGVHGHALKGLGLGLLAGAIVGGAIGATVEPDELLGRGFDIFVGGVLGAGGGALIGLGVGSSIRSERWRTMALQGEGHSALPPSGDTVELRVSLRFR